MNLARNPGTSVMPAGNTLGKRSSSTSRKRMFGWGPGAAVWDCASSGLTPGPLSRPAPATAPADFTKSRRFILGFSFFLGTRNRRCGGSVEGWSYLRRWECRVGWARASRNERGYAWLQAGEALGQFLGLTLAYQQLGLGGIGHGQGEAAAVVGFDGLDTVQIYQQLATGAKEGF